jgi:hypothetical protein
MPATSATSRLDDEVECDDGEAQRASSTGGGGGGSQARLLGDEHLFVDVWPLECAPHPLADGYYSARGLFGDADQVIGRGSAELGEVEPTGTLHVDRVEHERVCVHVQSHRRQRAMSERVTGQRLFPDLEVTSTISTGDRRRRGAPLTAPRARSG